MLLALQRVPFYLKVCIQPASLSTDFCRTVDQLSYECSHVGNFYLHSGAVLDNSATVSCGGRRFQLHLKYRGGYFPPWHSLHRHGPNDGVQVSMCANPVGFVADIKKKKTKSQKTPLPDTFHFEEPLGQRASISSYTESALGRGTVLLGLSGEWPSKGLQAICNFQTCQHLQWKHMGEKRPAPQPEPACSPHMKQVTWLSKPRWVPAALGKAPGLCGERGTHLVQRQGLPQGLALAAEVLTHFWTTPTGQDPAGIPLAGVGGGFSFTPASAAWQRVTPPGCPLSLGPIQFRTHTCSSSSLVQSQQWRRGNGSGPHLICKPWHMFLLGRSGKQL